MIAAEVLSLVVVGGAWLVFLIVVAADYRLTRRREHPDRCGCDVCREYLALDIARLERELDINQPTERTYRVRGWEYTYDDDGNKRVRRVGPEPPVEFDASKITAGMVRADKITAGSAAGSEPEPLCLGPLRILYDYGSDGNVQRTEIRAWGR